MTASFDELRLQKLDMSQALFALETGELPPPVAGTPMIGQRKHSRVSVRLAATVDINRGASYSAHTLDMSEGGTLISGFKGPRLPIGQMVGVSINGLVSDEGADAGRGSRFLMRVVRHEADRVALRFDH